MIDERLGAGGKPNSPGGGQNPNFFSKKQLKVARVKSIVSSHVYKIQKSFGDNPRDFEIEEAVKLVSDDVGDHPDVEQALIRDVLVKQHLKESTTNQGKYMFKIGQEDENLEED